MKTRILIFRRQCVMVALALLLPFRSAALDLLVYNTNNAGAGSLRQAINDNNAIGGTNTIIFFSTVTGSITLADELIIRKNVTILGPGRDVLTVTANNASRVLNVPSGNVAISGLTITRGQPFADGGGVYNAGTLHLTDCLLSVNTAHGGGGAVFNSGTLYLSNCLIATNNGTFGGGVYNSGTLHISDCVFSANGGFSDAGAVFSSGNLTADRCAFVNNSVGRRCGALFITNGVANLNNCTIVSNNVISYEGGGIYNDGGTLTVTACTIVSNNAGSGGGIYGLATVRNTIIAGNGTYNGVDSIDDVVGTYISEGYNLIGITNASTGWGAVGDLLGSASAPVSPYLSPLGLYGGSTPIMPPQPTSTVIDRGKSFGLTTDQRGRSRPVDSAYQNAPLGDGSDIGAVEISPVTLLVTTTNDAGPGSLRQAILNASTFDEDVVTFAANVTNTIGLTSGTLVVNKRLVIDGPGARRLSISGNGTNRVFDLSSPLFRISNLTVTKGSADQGGGIRVGDGFAYFVGCQIISNAATFSGGGIQVDGSAFVRLDNSSVTENQAAYLGGGVAQAGSSLLFIEQCTIAGNRTTAIPDILQPIGGGIALYGGSCLVGNSTIASNTSTANGGGIYNNAPSPAGVRSSIIAGNSAPAAAPDVIGPFASDGYNLVGNPSTSTGFTNTGDQINVNPLLGPLADYGGPTPTMALRAGSPAIDKGKSFGATNDQRGVTRILDDLTIPNANGGDGADIGALEVDPNFRIVELRRIGTDVALSMMTVLGRSYRAEYTNNLASGNWTIFTNSAPGNGYLLWVTNYGGANQSRRFYRGAIVP